MRPALQSTHLLLFPIIGELDTGPALGARRKQSLLSSNSLPDVEVALEGAVELVKPSARIGLLHIQAPR